MNKARQRRPGATQSNRNRLVIVAVVLAAAMIGGIILATIYFSDNDDGATTENPTQNVDGREAVPVGEGDSQTPDGSGNDGVAATENPTQNVVVREAVPVAEGDPQAPDGWDITTASGESELALARHLADTGAVMFGAWWCPHCYAQKQLFGEEAFEIFKGSANGGYVECFDYATGRQRTFACQRSDVAGFPTWQVGGEIVDPAGTVSLDILASASGYTGPTEFLYRSTFGGPASEG